MTLCRCQIAIYNMDPGLRQDDAKRLLHRLASKPSHRVNTNLCSRFRVKPGMTDRAFLKHTGTMPPLTTDNNSNNNLASLIQIAKSTHNFAIIGADLSNLLLTQRLLVTANLAFPKKAFCFGRFFPKALFSFLTF